MSAKKVAFSTQPVAKPAPTPDQWVESRTASPEEEKIKRLTLDLPESLHRRIKMECAKRGKKMADEIRRLLEAEFPE